MAICPRCSEEIDHLSEYDKTEVMYHFSVVDGEVVYEREEYYADPTSIDWECPECNEVLFTVVEKAKAFLLNGKEVSDGQAS